MNVTQFLRRYAPIIYGPTALFTLGQGAVVPLIPLIAIDLGANIATAALVAAAIVLGQVLGNLPAGAIVARFGERVTMVLSGTLALLGVAGMALASHLLLFAISVFFVGLCTASFGIARHAFMTRRVPFHFRARSLSLLGGSLPLWCVSGTLYRRCRGQNLRRQQDSVLVVCAVRDWSGAPRLAGTRPRTRR